MKARFTLWKLIAVVTCVAILLTAYIWHAAGVKVTVRNSGNSTLVDLKVHVTGKSYDLGDLNSGALKKCTLNPTEETNIEISYRLTDGTEKRHSIDCYIETGYRGTVNAEIFEGDRIEFSQEISLPLL